MTTRSSCKLWYEAPQYLRENCPTNKFIRLYDICYVILETDHLVHLCDLALQLSGSFFNIISLQLFLLSLTSKGNNGEFTLRWIKKDY
ncbi:MAG: hypothetical protein ACFFD4_26160 [Candidatus Odinarchaeota archaeon]